ncbi:Mut7-C RNAse domain-containing protein [Natrarchaeobius oligotrophus]|uniref:Mut7-C RNAse domain-containing protein n=1 Tax=Natrarchaeobius chitinivorans TaxID=1679083 RepID=A0A3N6MGJ4_NATCH|nr:Mut7-C RNAse domain-containing protein [Natrarchaeobius chitinivorans]RQH03109.1 hypothetical protein EA472_00470 [Natrarchaeobius chitinivorans]
MRLLVDLMCGGIVSYLRMCNHDAAYAGDRGLEADDDLLAVARAESRTLVTRDVALAARATRATDAILLESRETVDQLAELSDAGVDLSLADRPRFCGRCNGRLEGVDGAEPTPEYAPDPAETEVYRCRDCRQHFWRGTHWDRVSRTLSRLDRDSDDPLDGGQR